MTHICVSKLTTIGSDNGLSPGRRQAIIWTNAGILLIGPLGTNLSEVLSEIHTFSLKKMYLKLSSGKRRLFCLGLNVLKPYFMDSKSCWKYDKMSQPESQRAPYRQNNLGYYTGKVNILHDDNELDQTYESLYHPPHCQYSSEEANVHRNLEHEIISKCQMRRVKFVSVGNR